MSKLDMVEEIKYIVNYRLSQMGKKYTALSVVPQYFF